MSDNYDLQSGAAAPAAAPVLDYRPPVPKAYRPKMGLIGCGGIVTHHLKAMRALGVECVALCDVRREAAEKRRAEFFPGADVYTDAAALLARDDLEVVDIATHPGERVPLIEAALRAGKHVLSQKPFVLDLADGRRLADLADEKGLRLAVNQNGRWAPYFAYLLQAARGGHLGRLQYLELVMAWDHTWIRGSVFEHMRHVILYDFAIHWFDIAVNVFGDRPARRVFSALKSVPGQVVAPPMLGSTLVEWDDGVAVCSFMGHAKFGAQESFCAVGTEGTLRGAGKLCGIDRLVFSTAAGDAPVAVEGAWFPTGFIGSLGELLCSIEEGRPPFNNARDNLRSLEVGFAAVRSAEDGRPYAPGEVTTVDSGLRIPAGWEPGGR